MLQIVLHVNGYFDWEPVPADVKVEQADIDAKRVKPAQGGQWLMKVEKTADTETTITIPESELHETILGEFTRGDRQLMTRAQLAHRYVTRHHLSHNTHEDWIQEVVAHDDGPDEAGLNALLATHLTAAHGKISDRDVTRIMAKYLEPATVESTCAHFHKAYGVTPERIAERRRKHRHKQAQTAPKGDA